MDTVKDEDVKYSTAAAQSPAEVSADYPWVVRYPLQLCTNLLLSGFRLLRPYTPQLIPLAVFLLTIPVLLFLSLSAGFFVWRSIAVGWEVPLYLQYGDGISPYATVALPTIVSQQPYDISLHLSVPVSESNLGLGNFMVSLALNTPSNRTIDSIRRPALVLPSAFPRLSSLWNVPGMTELSIPLLHNVELGVSSAIAYVELGRKDQWRAIGSGEGRELSVASALLRGVVVHKGLRGIFTRFPLLTSLVAAATFFFISFVILASCVLPALEWQVRDDGESAESTVQEKPRRQRRRERDDSKSGARRRAVAPKRSQSLGASSRTSSQEIKVEEIPSAIPSTPLRRRRSRLSQSSEHESY